MPADLILLAHGARDERWRRPFEAVRRQLELGLPHRRVVLAYLEFVRPSLSEAVDALLHHPSDPASPEPILIVPVFLSGGGHVTRDVPVLVDAMRKRHPEVRFNLAGALGEEPEVAAAMITAIRRLLETADA